jgi:hypothetical protein
MRLSKYQYARKMRLKYGNDNVLEPQENPSALTGLRYNYKYSSGSLQKDNNSNLKKTILRQKENMSPSETYDRVRSVKKDIKELIRLSPEIENIPKRLKNVYGAL